MFCKVCYLIQAFLFGKIVNFLSDGTKSQQQFEPEDLKPTKLYIVGLPVSCAFNKKYTAKMGAPLLLLHLFQRYNLV